MFNAHAEPSIDPKQIEDIISTYLACAQESLSKCFSSEDISKLEQDIQEQEKGLEDSNAHLLESYRHMANLSNEKSMFQLSLKYYKKCYQLEVLQYQKNSISLVPTLLLLVELQINLALFKEAHETLEECFDIFKDKTKDNTLYMECKMTEAYLLYEQGKYEESLICLEKCDRVHLDTNFKLKFEFLALEAKLHSLLSHINKMRKFVRELFKEIESLGGNNETIYSKVFSLAAYSYFIEGKYEMSREYYLKSIKLALEAEPVDFRGIINSLLRLSHLCLVEGNNDLGIIIAKEAHSLCVKIFDENHCLSVTCMAFLGKVYREQCDFNKAIGILENSMKARIEMFGENSPFVIDSYIKMGEFFLIYTKYHLALEFLDKALKIHKILYNEKDYHFGIAGIYNLLGLIYLRLRNFNTAEENFSNALTNMHGLFGDDHPSVADYYGNLSIIQGNYYNRDKQLEYLKKTLSIQKKCLGRYHAKTAPAYENLGDLYSHRGEFDKAIRKCKKGIEIRIRSFGMSHPTICDTYFRLGLVYKRKGDNGEAIKCIMKALKVNLKFYPVPNRRNLALFNNLTTTYRAKGDIKEAEKFGKILADIKRVQENVNVYATLLDDLGKDMDRYEFSQCFL